MERDTQEAFQVVVREREPYITAPLNILVELGFGEGGAAGKGDTAGGEEASVFRRPAHQSWTSVGGSVA